MGDPLDDLGDATRDEWSDPVRRARNALSALIDVIDVDWEQTGLDAVRALRAKRADSALLLAVTEVALEPNPLRAADGLRAMLRTLDDSAWCAEIGLGVAQCASVGVLSLGAATMAILEAASELAGATPELFCDRRAVARGLGLLDMPILVADPSLAEVLLLPIAAQHKERIWTTPRNAEVARRSQDHGRRVVPVLHPLSNLSPLNRLAYRPRSYLIDILL